MNPDTPPTLDDQLDDWILGYHEALLTGSGDSSALGTPLPVELQPRALRLQECLDLIERAWPRRRPLSHPAPEQIGRFRIQHELGRGGFGIVFLATDTRLGRDVALKVPRGEALLDADLRRRFVDEARATADLSHPHVVVVLEAGEAGALLYIASEYCPGPNLARWLKDRGRPAEPRPAAQLAATLAEAVHYIHSRGILHRDLKPQNILLVLPAPGPSGDANALALDRYLAKVADFGLAKVLEHSGDATGTGVAVGTPRYMAPEQVQGRRQEIGWHTDVYALGTILYEMVTGRPPFAGETAQEVWQHVLAADPVPPSRLARVPRDLETICLKCLHKDPQRRYPTALALAEDLQRFLGDKPIQARPVGLLERVFKWARRRPAAATLAMISALLALVLPPVGWVYDGRVREARGQAAIEEEKRLAAEKVATVNRYHSLVSQVAESAARPTPGWTWQGLHDIAEAVQLDVAERDLPRLRSLAVRCFSSVDLRPVATLATGMQAFCTTFSPDGCRLAIGQELGLKKCSVLVYDVASRKRLLDLRIPTSATEISKTGVRALAFSPNGRWLVAGTSNGELHAWDLQQDPPARLARQVSEGGVTKLAFRPDGAILVASCLGDHLTVWETPSFRELARRAEKPLDGVHDVAFSPDGRLLGLGYAKGFKLFDAASVIDPERKPVERVAETTRSTSILAFSPDGQILAYTGMTYSGLLRPDPAVRVSGRHLDDPDLGPGFRMHEDVVKSSCFDRDGALLITGSADRSVKLWEIGTGKLAMVMPVPGTGNVHAAISQQSPFVAITADEQTVLYELRWFDESQQVGQHAWAVRQASFMAGGKALVCFSEYGNVPTQPPYGEVAIWEPATRRLLNSLPLNEKIALGQGARQFLVSSPAEDATLFGRPDAGAFYVWKPGEPGDPRRIEQALGTTPAYSPDGKVLWAALSGDKSNRVVSWSWPDMKVLSTWENKDSFAERGSSHIYCLTAGREWLLVGTMDPAAKLVRISSSDLVKEWLDLDSPVHSVALSPDETLAALGTQKGSVVLTRIPGGAVLQKVEAHRDEVTAVDFHRNGGLLVTASKDRTVHLWQRRGDTFQALLRLDFERAVLTASFSPDGSRLAVLVQGEHAVRVWDLERLRDRLRTMGLGW